MTETNKESPDFTKLSDENIKNFRKEEQISENKKWVSHIFCALFLYVTVPFIDKNIDVIGI